MLTSEPTNGSEPTKLVEDVKPPESASRSESAKLLEDLNLSIVFITNLSNSTIIESDPNESNSTIIVVEIITSLMD